MLHYRTTWSIIVLCCLSTICFSHDSTSIQSNNIKWPDTNPVSVKTNDSVASVVTKSAQKSNISFSPRYYHNKDMLTLLSNSEFTLNGETLLVGDKGGNLIKAMGSDTRSIQLVHDAYRARRAGTIWMIVAGVAALVTAVTIPYVELSREDNGYTTTTIFWLPPVTIGVVFGGIGFVQYSSLERKLDKAVHAYNDDVQENQ
ncbi:MAG: hypothetical protein ABSF80_02340 [Chitinispirillaceae bacterium]|jgi:hypothetical protein